MGSEACGAQCIRSTSTGGLLRGISGPSLTSWKTAEHFKDKVSCKQGRVAGRVVRGRNLYQICANLVGAIHAANDLEPLGRR
jgi:hypothetical protein